ncbi:MAG: cation transporter [Sphingomonadaceae bacterium]|nr:cation transporter [Sphingomonadaceae bacterium]
MGGDHDYHDHRGHDHGHDHGPGHSHAPKVSAGNQRRVGLAALLTGSFMLAEVVGGVVSGSLALLADAGHMLTDFAALALAWFGFHLASRPADWRRTYGFDRFSVLVAFVNGLSLFVIAAFILWEAAERLQAPPPIAAPTMLSVAVLGLFVNILAFWMLLGADRSNLNIRGALAHVAGDLLGSVGTIAAALIIMRTGWTAADPLLSVFVALIILRSAWAVTRDSAHILLEGAPSGMEADTVAADLAANVDGIESVHHIHVWSISEERPMATLHARIRADASPALVKTAIRERLKTRFHVDHATVEIENGDRAPVCH